MRYPYVFEPPRSCPAWREMVCPMALSPTNLAFEDARIMKAALQRLKLGATNYLATGRPFMLAVGLRKPHSPYRVANKFYNMYNPNNLVRPWQDQKVFPMRAQNISGLSWDFCPDVCTAYGCREPSGNPSILTENENRDIVRGYYAASTATDYRVRSKKKKKKKKKRKKKEKKEKRKKKGKGKKRTGI